MAQAVVIRFATIVPTEATLVLALVDSILGIVIQVLCFLANQEAAYKSTSTGRGSALLPQQALEEYCS